MWGFEQARCKVSEGSDAGRVLLTADHQALRSLCKHSCCRTLAIPLRVFKTLKRSGDREAWLICVSCRGQYCLLRGDKNFERTLDVLLSQLHGNRISVEHMLTAYNPRRRGREDRLSAQNKASVFYNGSDLTRFVLNLPSQIQIKLSLWAGFAYRTGKRSIFMSLHQIWLQIVAVCRLRGLFTKSCLSCL